MKNTRVIPVVVDGPNYVNRVLEHGVASAHLARQLSGRALVEYLNGRIRSIPGLSGTCESVEFVCSEKRFGSAAQKFNEPQQASLLDRLRAEAGVYVDVVSLPGSSEKGVDTTILNHLVDLVDSVEAVVLVSADRDFVPFVRKYRHRLKVVLLAVRDGFPVELRNEAYATIDLGADLAHLFSYSYPRIDVESLNEDSCALLFSEADDRNHNQLRITDSGRGHFSHGDIGDEELRGVRCRFETFAAGNDYVGPRAASDNAHIKEYLNDLRRAWRDGERGFID